MMFWDSLPPYWSVLLPNIGFALVLVGFKTSISIWYGPPKESLANRLLKTLEADSVFNRLVERRHSLRRELEAVAVKREKSPEDEDRLRELNEQIEENERLMMASVSRGVFEGIFLEDYLGYYLATLKFPRLCWVMVAANFSLGFGAYLVWSDVYPAFPVPLLAFETTVALHWTFYPTLFLVCSYKLGITHITLTTVAASVTAALFWGARRGAFCFVMPYLCTMGYATYEMFCVGETMAKMRLFTTQIS